MSVRKTVLRPERERLAELIARAREKAGMSQRALSRKLGWHEMTIHLIESSQRGIDVTELVDIAGLLKADPVELLRQALSPGSQDPPPG